MSNVFIGQILMFGGNFPPRDFAMCNGQLMSIAQNQALFALLGTTYGGDGISTFGLPNLQSQLPVHQGQGSGLSSYSLGQAGGSPSVTLTTNTMPNHNHALQATTAPATTVSIGSSVIPATATGDSAPFFYGTKQPSMPDLVPHPMAPGACTPTGNGQPHENLMPSLCITFIIALQGIFPSRN
jgi:microcystin-dependent protein